MTDLEQVAAWRTFEARDTLRLQLTGKIDEWFAKADGSGAVFLRRYRSRRSAQAARTTAPGSGGNDDL